MQEKYKKVYTLNTLISETNGAYHSLSRELGISDSVMQVLYTALVQGGSCTVRDACLLTGNSKQTINSALRKMEAQGLVVLTAVDRKKKRICLTQAGEQLARNTAGKELDLEAAILDSWPPEDTENYLRLTKRYLDDLRRGLLTLTKDRKEENE